MRRAIRPAICTDVTYVRCGLNDDRVAFVLGRGLSTAALRYEPGKYSTLLIAPSTGERCDVDIKHVHEHADLQRFATRIRIVRGFQGNIRPSAGHSTAFD